MIQLKPEQFDIVKKILLNYPYPFYVFGSRSRGDAAEFSDLDLAYDVDIGLTELAGLETAFSESDLPFNVDLLDLNTASDAFLEQIKTDLQPFPLNLSISTPSN